MSSSELLELQNRGEFRPDFPAVGSREFEFTLPVTPSSPEAESAGVDIQNLSAALGHSEEEIEARLREELRTEQESRLRALEAESRARLGQLQAELERVQETYRSELLAAATELAFAVAERVVRRELAADRDAVQRTLRDALQSVDEARSLRMRVHPDDVETVRADQESLRALRVEEIVADATVSAGGCVLESGERTWDATVGGQLEKLREALDAALGSES